MLFLKQPIFSFLLILLLCACVSRRDVAYFNELRDGQKLATEINHSLKIKTGDLLLVQVYSADLEASAPFNLPDMYSGGQLPGYANGVAPRQGYLVDSSGFIQMPVAGKLHLAGKSIEEAVDYLSKQLSAYLKDPVIHIRLLNFRVSVLGDVRNPGTYTVPNEHLSLPEALGIAGDLNISALRNNILVLRDDGKNRIAYRIDLRSSSALESPGFQLQQNDIVYVEPNRAQRNASGVNARAGIFISAASLIISLLILLQ